MRAQPLSHDCLIGEDRFQSLAQPVVVNEQRASGLPFGDRRVQALMHVLCLFALPPQGFRHRDLREHLAQLLGLDAATSGPGQMTYDLRRLRLHDLIERIPGTHRYRVTEAGIRTTLFYARLYARALRPALSLRPRPDTPRPRQRALEQLDATLGDSLREVNLAA